MGRKASTKIKVVLEIEELSYQRIAIAAGKLNQTVTGYLKSIADNIGAPPPEVLLPLLAPVALEPGKSLTVAPPVATTVEHALPPTKAGKGR